MLYLPLKYADKATHAVTVGEYCEDILSFSINICFFSGTSTWFLLLQMNFNIKCLGNIV